MAILQVNLCWPAPPVANWRILLVQSFTAHMPLLTAFGLERRRWSSPQQCYLRCLHAVFVCIKFQENATAIDCYFYNISYLYSNADYFGNSAVVLKSRVL